MNRLPIRSFSGTNCLGKGPMVGNDVQRVAPHRVYFDVVWVSIQVGPYFSDVHGLEIEP